MFENIDFDPSHCPLCSEAIENPLPSAQEIRDSITILSNKLDSVSRERPHLRQYADGLIDNRQQLREQADAIQLEINAIYEGNKEAIRLKDLNARRGRIIGRISLRLESVVTSDGMDGKRTKLTEIEARIAKIIIDNTGCQLMLWYRNKRIKQSLCRAGPVEYRQNLGLCA